MNQRLADVSRFATSDELKDTPNSLSAATISRIWLSRSFLDIFSGHVGVNSISSSSKTSWKMSVRRLKISPSVIVFVCLNRSGTGSLPRKRDYNRKAWSVNETAGAAAISPSRVAGGLAIIPLRGKCDEPLKVKPAPDPLHNPAQRALRILAIYPAELGSVTREASGDQSWGDNSNIWTCSALSDREPRRPADQIAAKATIYPVRHGKQIFSILPSVAIVAGIAEGL